MSTPFVEHVAERAARVDLVLGAREVAALTKYFELLRAWNRQINLTALPLEPATDEALDRLLVEPLAAARVLARRPQVTQSAIPRWIDLGSGGGSPAIPMKVALPSLHLTMVESKSRKAAFLREVVRALRWEDVDVVNARFESLAERSGSAELLTVRAVRVDAELARLAADLLGEQGLLLVFQSRQNQPDLQGFSKVAVERLLAELPSWLHVYSRLFHVEQ